MSAPDRDFPMIGETVGLWRLVSGLGRGGMGEVYEGEYDYIHILSLRYEASRQQEVRDEMQALPRDEQARLAAEVLGTVLPSDARFAIKICNARTGTAGHRRFLQEAELAERLGDHPYVVSVHAVNGGLNAAAGAPRRLELDRGRYRDVAFMVMDLATRTWDHTRLSIGEAVHIVRCIATALDHAHSKGVVHRDLKPENILGTIEHPLLTDFGIAKEIDQEEGLTRTGQIIGTLDYMSPEQATDAKRVDHRSDIYSLGVVLYEFATSGHLPYSHKLDRESCLAAIRSERSSPKWPREQVAGFPAGLERIILKAMAHRMSDRYQAMSDFIHDLDRFSRGEWIGLIGRVRVGDWLRFQTRYRPRSIWGAALVTTAGVAVLVWWLVVPLFDGERGRMASALDRLDTMVNALRERRRDQPTNAEQQMLGSLHADLADHRHGDLLDRLQNVERGLRAYRRVNVLFDGHNDNEDHEALKRAIGVESIAWRLGVDGLRIDSLVTVNVGPYGVGTSCFHIDLQSRSWDAFSIEARDPADRSVGTLRWSTQRGRFVLEHVAVSGAVSVLRDDPPLGSRTWLKIEWTRQGLRTWNFADQQTHQTPPLSAEAAVRWTITFPQDSTLTRICAGGSWP